MSVIEKKVPAGNVEQRYAGMEELWADVHDLTNEEIWELAPAEP